MPIIELTLSLSLGAPCLPWPPCCNAPGTYLRGIRLYGSQVVLQSQTAVVVENSLHSGEMSLHQPLPLSGDLLLQRLQHGLEVLTEGRQGKRDKDDVNHVPRENLNRRIKQDGKGPRTSFRACRSDFGRFLDWLSASAHSFII